MQGRTVLLVIGGGIAAYKSLTLIRELKREGCRVVPVLTRAAEEFVTPLSVAALAGEEVHRDLFDLTREAQMGHIQLSRDADLVVVVPATADLMAKMAGGHADDLASTLLMATDKRVLVAPAMNVRMWTHPATQRNLATLKADGILTVGPDEGDMACGEFGPGRAAEPEAIVAAIRDALDPQRPSPLLLGPEVAARPLAGRHVIVTSGPTREPIDPVRYISNHSSGAQGTAIAAALRDLGARVSFVTGPATVAPPDGVDVIRIQTAAEMRDAVDAALPADAAVMAAAVADWRVANASDQKMKKSRDGMPVLQFAENPDILAWVSGLADRRPDLVVGFAAETNDVVANATAKRLRKGCDWIVANDVSPETGTFGGESNTVTLISEAGAESWPRMGKDEVARKLAGRIAEAL
ncbi:bifunctional phosphopantothenoylcysteine decarboxylase/phosphopantothenate--cysteine ligase CoaBC [Paracoccus aerodenitrificans]|uniref:bifunctional phosphopantothenoylcysteine decarboxylase/phosphopantothenate--cysteine ligase CoaBC n=1 Tax=Paracoccus aerodenitrificans TaxID=3017781 RepID=UPI0022F07238|nr:bifunctional phosphopantothenoylcysteine decarboxylase/phosphopantothenate--cysteine ligase CoaBC [Paracoccus aerodenitrificans]WBU64644.1 bifunctional phosphopantothenoylcysteine decarboxylase/phosphopantothenate--cysteine ligase CoaBC [Paracoccus aerodenitrificans]